MFIVKKVDFSQIVLHWYISCTHSLVILFILSISLSISHFFALFQSNLNSLYGLSCFTGQAEKMNLMMVFWFWCKDGWKQLGFVGVAGVQRIKCCCVTRMLLPILSTQSMILTL